eukprot:COSAG05_NODE_9709_length_607_cov_0.785433_1_plen_181_part_10
MLVWLYNTFGRWGLDGRCMITPAKGREKKCTGIEPLNACGDVHSWSNTDFMKVRGTPVFKQQENAWDEQRGYFSAALQVLGPASKLAAAIQAELDAINSLIPSDSSDDVEGMVAVAPADFGKYFKLCASTAGCGRQQLSLRLDPASGAIISLINITSNRSSYLNSSAKDVVDWASARQPLA